jgi:hypothetical protein
MVSLRDTSIGLGSVLGLSNDASDSDESVRRKTVRRLEDAAADDDYVFPSPFLACTWSQDEDQNGVAAITQNCDYIVPNATDNEGEDPFTGYWIQSQCLWEDTYQYSVINCNVTDDLSLYMPMRPKYNVLCSTEKLVNGASTQDACKKGNAWLPDQKCLRECFSGGRRLEDVEGAFSQFCDDCYYSPGETCSFSFDDEETDALDYHGLAWSPTLIETMQESINAGGSKGASINLLDVPSDQPSLISNDFALGMTFYCSSGVYSGSSMTEVADTRTVGALAATLLALLSVLAITGRGYCKHRPNDKRDILVDGGTTGLSDHPIV